MTVAPALRSESPPTDARPQFTLRGLLLAIAALASLLAFLRVCGIFGALFVWGALLVYSRRCEAREEGETVIDFLWGVVMPAICLVYDPGFLHDAGLAFFFEQPGHWTQPEAMLAGPRPLVYAAIGLQMAVLSVWLLLGAAAGRASGFIAGVLGVGAVVAAGIGVVLLPMTMIGIFAMLLGFLGTTPWFTACCFRRQCLRAMEIARLRLNPRGRYAFVAAGATFAVAFPVVAALVVSAFRTG